jgi:outer membrane protein OmpA-like peptidoglycan-associated protein
MKIVTYILIGLLLVTLAGGAYFFQYIFKPMAVDYEKLKAGQPEFDKARKELGKYKEQEKLESGWTGPAAEKLRAGLSKDISDGKAEVVVAGNRIVINIREAVLFTPNSVTFAKDSQQSLANLASLLKDLKDKDILVGNTTMPAPAQGKGRKRVPAKDARTLASGRTLELVKYLVKNGVADGTLIAASYPSKLPERGFKIKEKKTIFIISSPAIVSTETPAPKQETKPAPAARSTPTVTAGSAASQTKSIPISPGPPKKVP